MREQEKPVNSSSLAHDLRHHCEGSLGGRGGPRTGCLTYCSLFFLAEARARCLSSALFHLIMREVKVSKLLKRMLPGKTFPMPVEIDVHPLCNVHTKEHTEEHRHLHIAVFPACNCEHKERDMEDDQAYQPWLCPVHRMNKP